LIASCKFEKKIYNNSNSFFKKKKENFMEEQNLEKTNFALDELKKSVHGLKDMLDDKKTSIIQQQEAYRSNMFQKNKKIDELQSALEMTIKKIEVMAQKIDGVIEQDGSSNNSN